MGLGGPKDPGLVAYTLAFFGIAHGLSSCDPLVLHVTKASAARLSFLSALAVGAWRPARPRIN